MSSFPILRLERKKISGGQDLSHLVEEFEHRFALLRWFSGKVGAAQLITSGWIDERSDQRTFVATQDLVCEQ